MPERTSKPKRPRDVSQRAKFIVDIATGEAEEAPEDEGKNPHAVALGKLGGKKGGPARAKSSARKSAQRSHERPLRHAGTNNDSRLFTFLHSSLPSEFCLRYKRIIVIRPSGDVMSRGDILLTRSDVERWKETKTELEVEIAAAQQKLLAVNRRLELAALLIGESKDTEKASEAQPVKPATENLEPMTDATLRMIRQRDGSATRRETKSDLRKAGYPERRLGNYFYTVMARHVERGHLLKDGDRYILPSMDESRPENGEAPSEQTQSATFDASIETGLAIQ